MFLYGLWESGRKYKQYRFTFILAGLSSLLSAFEILCTQYLGWSLFSQGPRWSLHMLYLLCDMTALVFMWRNTQENVGKIAVLQIGLYAAIAYLVGFAFSRATLMLQLPIVIYCNLIIILGWTLFITNLYPKEEKPLHSQ